jgi:hypothetical protein
MLAGLGSIQQRAQHRQPRIATKRHATCVPRRAEHHAKGQRATHVRASLQDGVALEPAFDAAVD